MAPAGRWKEVVVKLDKSSLKRFDPLERAPVVFFGAETKDTLRKIQLIRARMSDTGVLWIVRPKASKSRVNFQIPPLSPRPRPKP